MLYYAAISVQDDQKVKESARVVQKFNFTSGKGLGKQIKISVRYDSDVFFFIQFVS
jgi:hypothetical protein